jgi:hypothetical protein
MSSAGVSASVTAAPALLSAIIPRIPPTISSIPSFSEDSATAAMFQLHSSTELAVPFLKWFLFFLNGQAESHFVFYCG